MKDVTRQDVTDAWESALLAPIVDQMVETLTDHGLLAGVGEAACPNTIPGVRIVTTRSSTRGYILNPFHRVPNAQVDHVLFGDGSTCWTKLKIRTIYSTDPSQAADPSSPSLMIGGKAARTLSKDEVRHALKESEPLDVMWVNESNT